MTTLNTPIEMIAVYSKDGSIKPIRFRVETSDGEEHVIKIASLKHVNEEKFGQKIR